MGTTDLDVVLISDGLELVLVLLELGELDVHGGSHTGTAVGGASGDVAEVGVVLELGNGLNLSRGNRETLEDLADVGAILHGDYSKMVLLVDPDQEGLVVVVEDTTSLRPFSFEAAGLEILVTTLEKEVILNELLLLGFSHSCKGVVLALKLTLE
jgi:hypothetical protein